MKLSRPQTLGLILFVGSLLPAYFIAHWRFESNAGVIAERFENEHALHLSTDKLVANCERLQAKDNDRYDPNHVICKQGTQEHDQTARAMDALDQDKSRNDLRWYRNFFLTVLVLNALGWIVYKASQRIKLDDA